MRMIVRKLCVVLIGLLGFCACNGKPSIATKPNSTSVIAQASPTPEPLPLSAPFPPNTKFRPKAGYVPDAATAIKIAEAVWIPIYGEEHLKSEKPFHAALVSGVWIVQGTLPKGSVGGTAYAEISKDTGCILNVTHFK